MGNLVTLKRPDGSSIQVEEKDAPQLRSALGYRDETEEEQGLRNAQEAHDAYYSGMGQKVKTAIEGTASGLTLGLSDKLLQATTSAGITGDDWRHRAQANPGTRLGSELVGAIAPALLSGGESLSLSAPAGMLTEGATLATRGIGSAVTRGVVRGGIEGAGFGLGSEISNTALNNDPLTIEGALAGMGWGTLWGAGLGAVGGKIEARVARKSAIEAELATKSPALTLPEEKWGAFRDVVKDAGAKSEAAFKSAGDAMEAAAKGEEAVSTSVSARGKQAVEEARGIRTSVFHEPWTEDLGIAKADKKVAIEAYNDMKAALKQKDWVALEEASTRFNEKVKALEETRTQFNYRTQGSTELPNPKRFFWADPEGLPNPPKTEFGAKASQDAMNQLKELGGIGATLRTFSETPGGFIGMGSSKFEKMAGAIDQFLKQPAAELAGAQQALASGIDSLAEHVGVQGLEGGPVSKLRGVWETLKTAKPGKLAQDVVAGNVPGMSKMAQSAAGLGIAHATKTGFLGYSIGRNIAGGLLGVKGAVMGAISKAASNWAPKTARAIRVLGPKLEPLKTRLDGTIDAKEARMSAQDLMLARGKEIHEAANTVRDTLYKGVSPLDVHHPDFAAALHDFAVNQFKALFNKLPRDPGTAFNRMNSLWKPDPVDVAKFSRYYAVFQNPVQTITDALSGVRVSNEASTALQELWPGLFTHMRTELIQRMGDPDVLSKMGYEDQMQMSLLTGLRLHSTLTPQFIVQQQQMFQERNQPLKGSPQPGDAGTSGGRPDSSPGATQAQRATER